MALSIHEQADALVKFTENLLTFEHIPEDFIDVYLSVYDKYRFYVKTSTFGVQFAHNYIESVTIAKTASALFAAKTMTMKKTDYAFKNAPEAEDMIEDHLAGYFNLFDFVPEELANTMDNEENNDKINTAEIADRLVFRASSLIDRLGGSLQAFTVNYDGMRFNFLPARKIFEVESSSQNHHEAIKACVAANRKLRAKYRKSLNAALEADVKKSENTDIVPFRGENDVQDFSPASRVIANAKDEFTEGMTRPVNIPVSGAWLEFDSVQFRVPEKFNNHPYLPDICHEAQMKWNQIRPNLKKEKGWTRYELETEITHGISPI